MPKKVRQLFLYLYSSLLLFYPREFRQQYGSQMVLLLSDCQQHANGVTALLNLWLRTLLDLFRTAPIEHLQNRRKENQFMNKLRTDIVAIGGCLLIIIGAVLLLSVGRAQQVSPILHFGYILDALVFTGIVGNLIVFLLAKLTALNSRRVAFITFAIVCAVPPLAIIALAGLADPNFRAGNIVIGYVVSFLFWYGLHWLWSNKLKTSETI